MKNKYLKYIPIIGMEFTKAKNESEAFNAYQLICCIIALILIWTVY